MTVTPPIVGNLDIERAQAILDRRAKKYRFSVSGKLTLGPTSDNTDVLKENINVTIGGFSQTIPLGSYILKKVAPFGRTRTGSAGRFFELKKGVPGNITGMKIFDDGRFEITTGILDGVDPNNPLNISLQIGDDFGEKNVLFQKTTK